MCLSIRSDAKLLLQNLHSIKSINRNFSSLCVNYCNIWFHLCILKEGLSAHVGMVVCSDCNQHPVYLCYLRSPLLSQISDHCHVTVSLSLVSSRSPDCPVVNVYIEFGANLVIESQLRAGRLLHST